MILQEADFAFTFQVKDKIFNLAPSGSQWSDPDLPHQFSKRYGAVAKFSWWGQLNFRQIAYIIEYLRNQYGNIGYFFWRRVY
jgi:hypothetical protein